MLALQNTVDLNNEDLYYYETLVSNIDDIIISTDKEFRIKTWNAAAEKLYGLPAEEALGKHAGELAYVQYLDSTKDEAVRKLVTENYWKGKVKIITQHGKEFVLQSIVNTVRNEENEKLGYVGVSRDITKDIHDKQSLQNFSAVLNLLEESFLIVDKNFKVVFMRSKQNVRRFFEAGYKDGDSVFNYIPQPRIERAKSAYEKAFAGDIVKYDSDIDSEPRLFFNITYTPLRDDGGNITNVCVIIKDLTAQKEAELLEEQKEEAERNLYVTRKFFDDFMDNTHLLAWIVDINGDIHYMNSAFISSFEIEKSDCNKNIFELYPEEIANNYAESNKIIIETGVTVERVEKKFAKNSIPYKILKFPISYKNEVMVANWGVDIKDEMIQQEHLTQLNQNKNKIVSVIAHDVHGPLRVNASFLDTIIGDYKSLAEEEILKYLRMLKSGITKCYSLSEELLLWARGQLKSIAFKPSTLDTHNEINKVIENIKQVAEEKNITIETDFCDDNTTYADRDMFAIVIRNFISNAIKFSNPGSTIFVSTCDVQEESLKVSVKDSGIGVKKELADKLMNKTNYESSYGTNGEKGTGLGLIIAKDYIERNNGEMIIESEEGIGSTFSFTVRFAKN